MSCQISTNKKKMGTEKTHLLNGLLTAPKVYSIILVRREFYFSENGFSTAHPMSLRSLSETMLLRVNKQRLRPTSNAKTQIMPLMVWHPLLIIRLTVSRLTVIIFPSFLFHSWWIKIISELVMDSIVCKSKRQFQGSVDHQIESQSFQ